MDSPSHSSSSSLSVELKLLRARNIYMNTPREVFVRCYLSPQRNKRVRLDSQKISSDSNLTWNQTFSLKCFGREETIKSLKQGTIVFELWCRSSSTFLELMGGSKLLARAEMQWNDEIGEKWIVMIPKNKHEYIDDVKPLAVRIAMKVEEVKRESGRRSNDCDCMGCECNSFVDYDLFTLGVGLEAF